MSADNESGRLTLVSAADIEPRRREDDWGPWRLDPETYVLYPVEPYRYEVDLERCTTPAQVLDWICQVAGKSWADDATLAGLVRALNELLQPQANLCSWGAPGQLTRQAIRHACHAKKNLG